MKYVSLLLLLTLVSCAYVKNKQPVLINQDTYSGLQRKIAQSPRKLQLALRQELQIQPNSDTQGRIVISDNHHASLQDALRDVIYNSDHLNLNADNSFNRLVSIAGNSEQIAEAFYSEALANYLTRPDYSCHYPIYYRYFENRFNNADNTESCNSKVPFLILRHGLKPEIRWVDPSKVSSIHLVFTSEGENITSGFGHVSLRLVLCPENVEVSAHETCDRNLFEHIALGYQAYVNELSISVFKGLFGGYNARLFASNFMDFYQINAISEFRDIYSLPLLLTKQEREHLVRSLAQIHWQFIDSYSFFSNNCTSLLQNSIGLLWSEMARSNVMQTSYIRPDHFFSTVKQSSLVDAALLTDLAKAEEQGYYFPNTKPVYIKAFDVVNSHMTIPLVDSLDDYIETDPRKRFKHLKDDTTYYSFIKKDRYVLEAQMLLEEIAYLIYERNLVAKAASFIDDNNLLDNIEAYKPVVTNDQYNMLHGCILAPFTMNIRAMIPNRGIPESGDISALLQKNHCANSNGEVDLEEIYKVFERIDPDGWQPIANTLYFYKESVENILALRKMLAKM